MILEPEAAEAIEETLVEATEVPRDHPSSENAATDEEYVSATVAETDPEQVSAEAVRMTPSPEPDPASHAAEVTSEDPSLR